MDNYQNIIIFIIVAFLLAIGVHTLYGSRSREQFGGVIPLEDVPEEPTLKVRKPRLDYSNRVINFHKKDGIPIDQVTPDCVLAQNEKDTTDYMTKHLLGTSEICLLKPQTAKEFHKDFFSFRDKTYDNSSMRPDSVDFMNQLYLEGNTDIARQYPNMRIQDLFDEATKRGPNFYTRTCVRLPQFDNINPDQWTYERGNPGMHLVADEWVYPNEKVMNGGPIMGNIVGHNAHERHEKAY